MSGSRYCFNYINWGSNWCNYFNRRRSNRSCGWGFHNRCHRSRFNYRGRSNFNNRCRSIDNKGRYFICFFRSSFLCRSFFRSSFLCGLWLSAFYIALFFSGDFLHCSFFDSLNFFRLFITNKTIAFSTTTHTVGLRLNDGR